MLALRCDKQQEHAIRVVSVKIGQMKLMNQLCFGFTDSGGHLD